MSPRVFVVSPYRGNIFQRWRNRRYARECLRDCLHRGESPFAGHLLYTQKGVLRDYVPLERGWGMAAARDWMMKADLVAVYTDLGISPGMWEDEAFAFKCQIPFERRTLTNNP